jgi:outer membrane protein assembly factor BamB
MQATDSPLAPSNTLRWWPAALLVVAMVLIRLSPQAFESPGLALFMFAFMMPAVLGLGILIWWLFASRASWKERLVGFFVVLAIATVSCISLDKSMSQMGPMFFVIPLGCIAFAVPLILLAGSPQNRLPVALMCALLGFGIWPFVRSEGVSGSFQSEFAWRLSESAEEKYLTQLAETKKVDGTESSIPPITLSSSQWPSFRGSARDGKVYGLVIAEDWKASPPTLKWKKPIGPAWSSFAMASKYLFTQEQRGDKEVVLCLDADNGETVWLFEYESRFWEPLAGAGPRATPTIADEGLFVMGADGLLIRLDASNGKEIWRRDLKTDADRQPPMWGFSSSPLVTGGLVIVHAGGKGTQGVLAYKAADGELAWSVASGDHSYSSPQLANLKGTPGILMETNAGVQYLNPTDGATLWEHDWKFDNYRALQPLVVNNSVLIATGLGGGTRKITPQQSGDAWTIDVDWTSKDMKPDFNDFVEHRGFLYGFDGSIFGCINLADGKRQWKKGRYGNGQVLLIADGGQLLITSEQGELALVKADEKQFVELAKIQAIEGKTWNHSVVHGNRVYIRNGNEAACYELPAANKGSDEVTNQSQ